MMLKNKLALITGSNRGIGLAILKKFSDNGADIIECARNKDAKTVIYKNERIAILRGDGGAKSLIEVIVAFDELTKEGYRLMSTGSAFDLAGRTNMIAGFGGPSGNTFLYFQKF